MNDWDKILDDFARKCKGGAPDMTNPRHLALLRESLLKFGWKENATNEFIGNLREGKASEMAKKVGLKHIGGGYYSKTGEKPATHKSSEKGSILVQVDKDEESEVEESEKDIQKRIKDKNQKSARRHTQNRFSEERKEMVKNNHPEYSEYEEIKFLSNNEFI